MGIFRKLLNRITNYLDSTDVENHKAHITDGNNNFNALRVIKTARDIESMNNAIKQGNKLVVKEVEETNKFKRKYKLVQHKKTNEIMEFGDFRANNDRDFNTLIDWTSYNSAVFKNPYAAYIIPKDLKMGERVLIEDLIEHYVSGSWNQGDVFRLSRSEAVWNGKDFDIDVRSYAIGEFIG